MKRDAVALCMILLASPVFGSSRKIDLKLSPHEWISAAEVRDDGAAVVVVAQTKPRATRLLRIDERGNVATTRLQQLAVNHFETLSGGRSFIGGSIDAERGGMYVNRVVEWKNGTVETIWQSSDLPARIMERDPYIRVSGDGTLWGAVAQANGTLHFTWGELPSPAPRATITVESRAAERPDGFVFDGTDIRFVRTTGETRVAAVLWLGRVYLFDLTTGSVVTVLAPPLGGSTLQLDVLEDVLWVGGNEWAGFDVADVLRNAKPDRAQRPSRVRQDETIAGVAAHALTRRSPRGGARLIATEGPLGSTLEIRTRD